MKSKKIAFLSVMLCFFTMGFVDLVGIASNYVTADLGLTDSQANIMPSLVFFWFLIFSVPTGLLMNKIGRRNTVLLSIVLTIGSLVVPIFGDTYPMMLVAFSLLGIGNAIMQTSLNPLVSNLVSGNRLASTMTLGQFVKAIASFLAPIIAAWGATAAIPTFGLQWRILFPIYAIVGLVATIALFATNIKEEPADEASSVVSCLKLLGKPFVLLCFIGIMCHVGIDVGTNTTAPKLLVERAGMTIGAAGFATSVSFIFRTIGCFTGSFILRFFSAKSFFFVSALMIAGGLAGLFYASTEMSIYLCLALIGYGNSNIFSIIFSQALLSEPKKKNEVSGLMIMGLFGGTLFPLAMGYATDFIQSQSGAVAVMAVGALYLLIYTLKINKSHE